MTSCIDERQRNLVNKLFLRYNRDEISHLSKDGLFNLFIPHTLGGCGFKGTPGMITDYQRALASYLVTRHESEGRVWEDSVRLAPRHPECLGFYEIERVPARMSVPTDVPRKGERRGFIEWVGRAPNCVGAAPDTELVYRHPRSSFKRQKLLEIDEILDYPETLVPYYFL